MKRIEKFIILLVFLEILVGCSSLSNIGGDGHFGNYSIPNTNLTVYVDLSNEEWDQYSYIPTNLFEYNGSIYFKERYRLYKVDGMTAELCWKDQGVRNFINFNDNIYWWRSNYIPSSRSSISSFDEIFLYNINSHDSKSDGTINDKLNKFNRDLEGIYGNSILPSHWYGEFFYYAKTDEDNDLVSIFEYNTETDNIRTIKNNIASLDEFKIFHTTDNIIVCHFPSCQYYKNSKDRFCQILEKDSHISFGDFLVICLLDQGVIDSKANIVIKLLLVIQAIIITFISGYIYQNVYKILDGE